LLNEIAGLPDNPSTKPVLSLSKGSGRGFALVLDDYHVNETHREFTTNREIHLYQRLIK
jgi:hypothetical protein